MKPALNQPEDDREKERIASELARARKVLGLTQMQLHQLTGLARDSLVKYETGKHLPGARELRILCKALQISPNRLLFGTEDFNSTPSPAPDFWSDSEASEQRRFYRFMVIFNMLTGEEQRATMTLLQGIITARKSKKELAQVTAALDVFMEEFSPEMMAMRESVEKAADDKTRQKSVKKKIREAVKAAK